MTFDKPLTAVFIGVLSTIPFEVFLRIVMFLGLAKYSLYQLDSLVITSNRPASIIGFIISSMVAGFTALILYYALEKVGTGYMVIKSSLISLLAWSILETIVTLGFEGTKIPYRPMTDYYSHFIGAVIFGITMGVLFKKYLITSKQTT